MVPLEAVSRDCLAEFSQRVLRTITFLDWWWRTRGHADRSQTNSVRPLSNTNQLMLPVLASPPSHHSAATAVHHRVATILCSHYSTALALIFIKHIATSHNKSEERTAPGLIGSIFYTCRYVGKHWARKQEDPVSSPDLTRLFPHELCQRES